MKKTVFSLALCALACVAVNAADITISDPFVKATPPNAKATGAFMMIKNSSDKEIKLIEASNDVSKFTELHTHMKVDGMMKMVQVKDIAVPAHGEVALKPGDLHIMLIGLDKEIKVGDKVNLTLKFDNNESVTLKDVEAKQVMMKGHQHGQQKK